MVGYGAGEAASANMLVVLACIFLASSASSELLGLYQGAACEALGQEPGTCQLLTDCYNPGDFKAISPPICSFQGRIPIICCPNSLGLTEDDFRFKTKTRKALNYCRNYSSICEKQRDLAGSAVVLDGKNERPYDYTYMAIIGYGNESHKVWNCGGSMITTRFILSSAGCSEQYLLGPARWARLGGLEILFSVAMDSKAKDWRIAERIVHPGFVEPALYNDLALFMLQEEVSFDMWLGPLCLHPNLTIPTEEVSAVIWGKEDNTQVNPTLLESNLIIYNDEACQSLVNTSSKFPKSINPQLMFCAGVKEARTEKCSVETGGGPLLISQEGQCLKTQIGIASYRKRSCNDPKYPTIYTRISHYFPWIVDTVFRN